MPILVEPYIEAVNGKRSIEKIPVKNTQSNVQQKLFAVNHTYRNFCQDIIWSGLLVLFAFLALFSLLCHFKKYSLLR